MKNVFKIYLNYIWYLLAASIFLVGEALCELQLPGYISNIITYGVAVSDLSAVKFYGSKMIIYTLGSITCAICFGFLISYSSANIAKDLRKNLFAKTINLDYQQVNSFGISSLITRCSNDITQLQNVLVTILRVMIYVPFMGVGGILKALEYSAGIKQIEQLIVMGIALVALVIIGAIILVLPNVRKMQKQVDEVNKLSNEELNGKLVIKSFNKEEYEKEKFNKANENLKKTSTVINRIMAVMIPAMTTIMYVLSIVILIIIKNVVEDISQIANMLAFIQYIMCIIIAFTTIAMAFVILPRAIVSMKRISQVFDTKDDMENKGAIDKLENFDIKFDAVSYSYDKINNALNKVSFEIKEGESVGIIGITGSGKTTLVQLIPKLIKPDAGKVYIGGVDLQNIETSFIRKNISFVSQKATLFMGNIRNNISFKDEIMDDEKIMQAANDAQLEKLIKDEGLEKEVSQQGTNISGGQKQRVSIARALAKDSKIYIFDDAFSSLDLKTEKLIKNSIENKLQEKTRIFISQRISTIKDLNKIIVLNNGEVEDIGTHQELINSCQLYKEIAKSQIAEDEL